MKFLCFAHHKEVMDGLEDAVKKRKIGYIRIDGSVPIAKRYDRVKQFQNDPTIMAAILSLTASAQGITLTAASTVVFAEVNTPS